jgi:hypothetical protein
MDATHMLGYAEHASTTLSIKEFEKNVKIPKYSHDPNN